MKVKEIKEAVVTNDVEKVTFFDIININEEEEITEDELDEIIDCADPYELAVDHITDYNKDLLDWYNKDTSRLYLYANKSDLFSNNDVIKVLQDGQRIYWEGEIRKMRSKLYSFIDDFSY